MSDDDNASPGSIMLLHKINRGGVICEAQLACSIGELLLQCHYGADELARQRPLTAIDKGECWRVEGAQSHGRLTGHGPFFLTISKADGRITDLGVWHGYSADPNVLAQIRAGEFPDDLTDPRQADQETGTSPSRSVK